MKRDIEEVEVSITSKELLVKKYFAGFNDDNKAFTNITITTSLPIINAKAEDKLGNLNTYFERTINNQTSLDTQFRKPIQPNEKFSYKLTLLIDDSFIERIGNIKILNWPVENITKIWLENQELFFSSALSTIKKHNSSYELIPTTDSRQLISHSRKSSAIRIEYGSPLNYHFEIFYTLLNGSPVTCTDVDIAMHLPTTTKYQSVKLISAPENSELISDKDKNSILKIHYPEIQANQTITNRIVLQIRPMKQFIDFETRLGDFKHYVNLTSEGTLGSELITSGKYWPINDSKITELVRAAIKGYTETSDIVQLLFEFVNQKIKYEMNFERQPANVALETRRGDCSEMSDLFVTLLRRARIPARSVLGWIFSPKTNSLEGHAWAEYFTPNHGWIQCDPTWGFLAGVSCQHICRMREGVNTGIADSSVNYKSKNGNGKLRIIEEDRIIKIT